MGTASQFSVSPASSSIADFLAALASEAWARAARSIDSTAPKHHRLAGFLSAEVRQRLAAERAGRLRAARPALFARLGERVGGG